MTEEQSEFSLRPDPKKKFRADVVKEEVSRLLKERLEGQEYQPDEVNQQVKDTADSIRNTLKELQWDRYKFIVQVVIGEQRGEGMKIGCRTLWDQDTDAYAEAVFMSKQLFAVATVWGVYHY